MTDVTRRTLLLSTAVLGTAILTACAPDATSRNPQSSGSTTGAAPAAGAGARANEAQYGVGSYNTQEVADELRYIEQNTFPLHAGKGRRREY